MGLPTMHIADATILEHMDSVTLWRVRGIDDVWYPTKMAAEIVTRVRFNEESMEQRYSRISYKTFNLED